MEYRRSERLLTCPYESTHQIDPHRMAKHLAKCKKNYPEADMKTCVFNATHVIPTQEFQAHISQCPDRSHVDREIYAQRLNGSRRPQAPLANLPIAPQPDISEENWESELVAKSYDPNTTIIYREFCRPPPPGLGAAARKAWRNREIERVRRLKAGLPIHDLIGDTSSMVSSSSGSDNDTTLDNDPANNITTLQVAPGIGRGKRLMGLGFEGSSSREVMRLAEQPLRRPRIAANIFNANNLDRIPGENQVEGNNESDGGMDQTFIKEKRKLEKKLDQIEKLSLKGERGETLTAQEEEKVGKKGEYEAQLTELMAGMGL